MYASAQMRQPSVHNISCYINHLEDLDMNMFHAKCATRVLVGRVQASIGHMVGSRSQQTKGLLNQVLGHADRVLVQARAQLKDAQMGKLG
jgi:uncharacterized protein YjbJ (UPF0337 family)